MNTYGIRTLPLAIVLSALTAALAGCNSDDSPAMGRVSFSITDAPVDDVSRVQLTVTALSLKPANGSAVMLTLETPLIIENLLDLQGGNAVALLGPERVPAGRYNWVRLYVTPGGTDSFVVDDTGGTHDLLIPGQQSTNPHSRYVQLVSGFVVPAGGSADFTIDVDLRRALTLPSSGDEYFLRPALRIVDNSDAGAIEGTVDDQLIQGEACTADVATGAGNAVYLYSGHNALTEDIYLDDLGLPLAPGNPVSVTPVKQNDDGSWGYLFAYVSPGDYTVAFTCQANGDEPAVDDTLLMEDATNVTVTANATTTADLAATP